MLSQAVRGVSACLYYIRLLQTLSASPGYGSLRNLTTGHPAGSSSHMMSHVQACPAVWFSQSPER
jgi:hypothetical protein